MKIKLYIGAHKTATTHVQSTLELNRDKLCSHDIKLSLPGSLRKKWLPAFLRYCHSNDKTTLSDILSKAPQHGSWIIAEENISGKPYDFITNLGLYPHLKGRLSCLRQIFKSAEIEIFFSIRCYDTFYRSLYLEVVRNNGYMPFQEFYNENRFKSTSWVNVLDTFTRIIPEENITIWCYEDFRKLSPLVLTTITGLNSTNELISRNHAEITRPSLSKEAIDILSSLYPVISNEESKQLVERINSAYPRNENNEPYCPFSKEEVEKFQDKYKQDIATIKHKYPNINFL